MIFKYDLKQTVKDTLTPYEGVIVARTDYLDGEKRYLLQPNGCTDSGTPIESYWFTEKRLTTVTTKGTP